MTVSTIALPWKCVFRQRYPSTESVVALSYVASSITHVASKVGVVFDYSSGCGHLSMCLCAGPQCACVCLVTSLIFLEVHV